jgi:hypothetical protein
MAAYASNLNRVHGGAAANTVGNTVFTFGTVAAGGAILKSLTFINSNTTTKSHVTAYLVPNGGSILANNEIVEVDVAPSDTVIVRGPWYENTSAFVVVKADIATLVCRVTANELS